MCLWEAGVDGRKVAWAQQEWIMKRKKTKDICASISTALYGLSSSLIRVMAIITNRKCDRKSTPLFDAAAVPRLREIRRTKMSRIWSAASAASVCTADALRTAMKRHQWNGDWARAKQFAETQEMTELSINYVTLVANEQQASLVYTF